MGMGMGRAVRAVNGVYGELLFPILLLLYDMLCFWILVLEHWDFNIL